MSKQKNTDSKLKNAKENTSPKQASNEKPIVFPFKKIKPENILISEINKDFAQPIAYVTYDNVATKTQLKIVNQTGNIKLTGGGIPTYHEQFYPTEEKREFIKVPFDPEQPESMKLKDYCTMLDTHFGSEEVKKKLFGKFADRYKYSQCVNVPKKKDDEEEEDLPKKGKDTKENKKYPQYETCKMKFSIIKEGDVRRNMTKLIRVEGDKKTNVDAPTMLDVINNITFLSTIRVIFTISKLWINKQPAAGSDCKLYGIGFKILVIEFTSNQTKRVDLSGLDFVESNSEEETKETKKDDSDDESEEAPKKPTSTKPVKKPVKKEDSDDESGDSSEEAPKPTPTKPVKKPVKKEDSDDESEEAPKPPPKKPTKKVVDSDDESEEAPKKPTPKKQPTKKVVESDSDDDIPVKPVKKPVNKRK